MKLVVGLGNFGDEYQHTRHNLGFMALDAYAATHGLTWLKKDRFKGFVAEGTVDGTKIILLKPATFYNASGEAVQAVARFYKIGLSNILVVHDELALPFGAIRTRRGGSDAGNNGLKSIMAALGADFARLRIGIANEHLAQADAADFVLSHFTAPESAQLAELKKHAIQQIGVFINNAFDHTTIKV